MGKQLKLTYHTDGELEETREKKHTTMLMKHMLADTALLMPGVPLGPQLLSGA